MLRRVFVHSKEEITVGWKVLHEEPRVFLYSRSTVASPSSSFVGKGHIACVEEIDECI
jgi:hypothetical protein